MFPGNVYNYGADMPAGARRDDADAADLAQGPLRVEMEHRMREASDRGVRTIILRAGDFFGGGRGSWFDLVIAKDLANGIVTYPGPLDVVHEWAYLPDLVAAMVRLAEVRDRLGPFETFGFPGHAVTGREFVARDRQGDAARRSRSADELVADAHAARPLLPLRRELSEIGLSLEGAAPDRRAASSRPRSARCRIRRSRSRWPGRCANWARLRECDPDLHGTS